MLRANQPGLEGSAGLRPQGDQGPQGAQGPKGNTGDQGPPGQDAPTNTYVAKSGDQMTGPLILAAGSTAPTPPPGDSDTSVATTAFVMAAVGAVPGGAIINPTPPTTPAPLPGELWWDSTGGQLYVYYNDGNSSQWVTAANMQGLANAATQTQLAAVAAQAQNNVGRNVIHNPLFNVAQRGVGPFTTSGAYSADRWQLVLSGDTASVTRVAASDAIRTVVGDEAFQFFLSNAFTGTATATAFNELVHKIEGVRRLAGKTVILSFWAWCSTGALNLGLSGYNNYGTGGSPSGPDGFTMSAVALATTVTRFSRTVIIPTAVGKTLGTNGDDSINLQFWCSSATNNAAQAGIGVQSGAINLWGVQLEIAQAGQTQPTPLEKPDPQQDLAKCQRFYQLASLIAANYGVAGSAAQVSNLLPVVMRGNPTVTPTNNANSNVSGLTLGGDTAKVYTSGATATATGTVWISQNMTLSADL